MGKGPGDARAGEVVGEIKVSDFGFLGVAANAKFLGIGGRNLENLISSGEEPHCPPLTSGLSALSLSLSLSL